MMQQCVEGVDRDLFSDYCNKRYLLEAHSHRPPVETELSLEKENIKTKEKTSMKNVSSPLTELNLGSPAFSLSSDW